MGMLSCMSTVCNSGCTWMRKTERVNSENARSAYQKGKGAGERCLNTGVFGTSFARLVAGVLIATEHCTRHK